MDKPVSQQVSSDVILHLANVTKSYGSVKALKDVSFDLAPGFHALLGPNGAGKSTLFQLLSGLFVPDQGKIIVNGYDIRTQLTNVLATMGVVFQQASLDLDLTVQANLSFYGRLHGMSGKQIAERSQIEMTQLGIADVARRRCRTLSGGNRRKVELVRALLTEPRLLLMDEATVGLDPASRETLLKHVHSLCDKRQMSVLWATHLIDEAEEADQVLVLHQGELLSHDRPSELVRHSGCDNLLGAFLALSGQSLDVERDVVRV